MTLLPEYHRGMRRWVAPEVKEIIDLIQKGDPTCGWEGDPFLDLYWNERTGRWVLCRHENDELSIVMQSRPGMKLDRRIIEHLVRHDRWRGYNVVDEVIKQNEYIERQREYVYMQKMGEFAERLDFALHKDIGQHL